MGVRLILGCILICLQVVSPVLLGGTAAAAQPDDGSVLPFPPTPSGSKATRTMQESTYSPLPKPQRLPKDAPNIIIILIDDAGPALPDTYGGDIHTPALSRVAEEGISFDQFHTTAMCSPTRAALLTGRNHHRVGAGVIASLGNDWDGYTGVWPATSGSLAKVIGYYEYNMMIIERYIAKSDEKIAAGKHRIEVDTTIAKPGAPAEVILKVDGNEVARATVKRTVPAAFTASETFDVGIDLGSPVSLEYFSRRPFPFSGKIEKMEVKLK